MNDWLYLSFWSTKLCSLFENSWKEGEFVHHYSLKFYDRVSAQRDILNSSRVETHKLKRNSHWRYFAYFAVNRFSQYFNTALFCLNDPSQFGFMMPYFAFSMCFYFFICEVNFSAGKHLNCVQFLLELHGSWSERSVFSMDKIAKWLYNHVNWRLCSCINLCL